MAAIFLPLIAANTNSQLNKNNSNKQVCMVLAGRSVFSKSLAIKKKSNVIITIDAATGANRYPNGANISADKKTVVG